MQNFKQIPIQTSYQFIELEKDDHDDDDDAYIDILRERKNQ